MQLGRYQIGVAEVEHVLSLIRGRRFTCKYSIRQHQAIRVLNKITKSSKNVDVAVTVRSGSSLDSRGYGRTDPSR
jgi:hypothetical protein